MAGRESSWKKTITQIILNDESICGLPSIDRTQEDELQEETDLSKDSLMDKLNISGETMNLNDTVLTAADSELES